MPRQEPGHEEVTNLIDLWVVVRDKNVGPPGVPNACISSTLYEASLDTWREYYSFPRLHLSTSLDENQLEPFVLQPSLFHKNHLPPTVYFKTKLNDETKPPIGLPMILQPFFKWKISSITPNSIRNCISFMKFETIRPANTTDNFYIGSWCKHMLIAEFSRLEEWRKVNHYPGSFHLGRKDKLSLRLKLADQKYNGEEFNNFHPKTFVLPKDYNELKEYWTNSPSKLFIIKPPASARGNGIKVINDISRIPTKALEAPVVDGVPSKRSTMIVQQYISNPCLLENGQKFDLRIYVLLTSVDPLRLYVYEEGLVRFASSKYTSQEDGIIDQYMHLTNYFVNKTNRKYQINNDCDSLSGCKWTLKRFWRYLEEHCRHIDTKNLWENIIDIIVKTVICCEGPMTRLSQQNCKNDYTSYELFGFDIILDENFKPWILEVNITPSLKSESDLDTNVKYQVIRDMFNLVGYNLPPPICETQPGPLNNCQLFFDSRFYTSNLTKYDKLKHSRYNKLFKSELAANITKLPVQSIDTQPRGPIDGCAQTVTIGKESTVTYKGDEINPRVTNNEQSCNEEEEDCEQTHITRDSILNDLSQEDIRILMLSEDELSRCGSFKRVFPSSGSTKYLKYFDKPRYNNLLLDAWERRYQNDRIEGINRLSCLANF